MNSAVHQRLGMKVNYQNQNVKSSLWRISTIQVCNIAAKGQGHAAKAWKAAGKKIHFMLKFDAAIQPTEKLIIWG